MTFANY